MVVRWNKVVDVVVNVHARRDLLDLLPDTSGHNCQIDWSHLENSGGVCLRWHYSHLRHKSDGGGRVGNVGLLLERFTLVRTRGMFESELMIIARQLIERPEIIRVNFFAS